MSLCILVTLIQGLHSPPGEATELRSSAANLSPVAQTVTQTLTQAVTQTGLQGPGWESMGPRLLSLMSPVTQGQKYH